MKQLNENELKYGTGLITEKDVVLQCITNIVKIESVIDIKGLDIIHLYLSERLQKADK